MKDKYGVNVHTSYEDYVEVILSGEEQFDERVTLYFDGSVVSPEIL